MLSASVSGQAAAGYEPELRDRVLVPGVLAGASLFGDWSGVWHGGLRRRDTFRALADVHVQLESEPLLGWKGTTVFFDAYWQDGRDGSLDTGDIQVYSNLDTPDRTQVASLWIEHSLASGRARFKVGKVDANTEFAYVPSAGDFMHSSAGFSPTIVGFPSYPDPAMSVNSFLSSKPDGQGLNVRVGVYDGSTAEGFATGRRGPSTFFEDRHSDALFLIGEVGGTWDGGTASVGVWRHTASLPRFDGGTKSGTNGCHAIFEQRVLGNRRDGSEWSLSGAYGWADEDVSPMKLHASLGLVGVGFVPGRDRDSLGIFVSHVEVSEHPASGAVQDETAFELFYRVRVNRHVFIQPVLQYLRRPALAPGVEDAVVATLRFEFRW